MQVDTNRAPSVSIEFRFKNKCWKPAATQESVPSLTLMNIVPVNLTGAPCDTFKSLAP